MGSVLIKRKLVGVTPHLRSQDIRDKDGINRMAVCKKCAINIFKDEAKGI